MPSIVNDWLMFPALYSMVQMSSPYANSAKKVTHHFPSSYFKAAAIIFAYEKHLITSVACLIPHPALLRELIVHLDCTTISFSRTFLRTGILSQMPMHSKHSSG